MGLELEVFTHSLCGLSVTCTTDHVIKASPPIGRESAVGGHCFLLYSSRGHGVPPPPPHLCSLLAIHEVLGATLHPLL